MFRESQRGHLWCCCGCGGGGLGGGCLFSSPPLPSSFSINLFTYLASVDPLLLLRVCVYLVDLCIGFVFIYQEMVGGLVPWLGYACKYLYSKAIRVCV